VSDSRTSSYEDLSDLELVREVRNGRVGAFEALATRVKRDVFLALWFNDIRDAERAEKLARLALERVFDGLGSFEDSVCFTWWIKSIARDAAIGLVRREGTAASSG
jgi:hypothetical protein